MVLREGGREGKRGGREREGRGEGDTMSVSLSTEL